MSLLLLAPTPTLPLLGPVSGPVPVLVLIQESDTDGEVAFEMPTADVIGAVGTPVLALVSVLVTVVVVLEVVAAGGTTPYPTGGYPVPGGGGG